MNDYQKLYEQNEDFHEYVDRYAKKDGRPVEECLQHAVIHEYSKWLRKQGKVRYDDEGGCHE